MLETTVVGWHLQARESNIIPLGFTTVQKPWFLNRFPNVHTNKSVNQFQATHV